MESIRTRFGNRVHDRATELSVFGVEAVRDKPKFFDRIKVRNQTGAQVAAFAQENNLGTIVGTKTAGRLLSGDRFSLGHGYLLGLATAQ